MDEDKEESERTQRIQNAIRDKFEAELNKHGYGFQYSVINRFEELQKKMFTGWEPVGFEFPVEIVDRSTHIDFVLRKTSHTQPRRFLVAECKRVDPSKGVWCFAKSPYTYFDVYEMETIFEIVKSPEQIAGYELTTGGVFNSETIYHIGTEISSGERGDGTGGRSKSAINDAVAQVLTGTSGLINYLCTDRPEKNLLDTNVEHIFIPVVFTTAKIFVTDVELEKADLLTGKLKQDSVEIEERDWIWINVNRSPGLSHGRELTYQKTNVHFEDFARTVAIVSPSGIDKFFRSI